MFHMASRRRRRGNLINDVGRADDFFFIVEQFARDAINVTTLLESPLKFFLEDVLLSNYLDEVEHDIIELSKPRSVLSAEAEG